MYNTDEYVNFSLSHRRPLFEADDDPNEAEGGEEAPAVEAPEGEAEANDNAEENTDEEGTDEEPSEDEGDEDFDINGEDPEGGEEGEGGTEEGDEEGGEEAPADTRNEEPALGDNTDYTNPNIEREKEIYDDLSPEEQQMKDKALRKQYSDLYSNIEQVIDKLDNISVEMEDINAEIKRLIMILYEYKQIIHDYFINLYNSKSYIENLQNYEKYKLLLYGIKKIIETIDKSSDVDNK